jgi:DNA polymerase-3 subunit delta
MIVKFYELKKNIKPNTKFYLLYGVNSGLIEESIDSIFKLNFSKNIFYYDESEIFSNLEEFNETIFNKSFFDNDKLIIISRATDKILNIIEEIIDKKVGDLKIIIKSSILEKRSKLRVFFEKDKDLVVVPFYEDSNQSLMYLAQNFLKEKKIKMSSQNINHIVERSKGNRINLKNELEKISSYCQNKSSIELNEILKLTNLSENYDFSELVDACLARNKKKTLNILNENNPSSEDSIIILRTFLYKIKRLKKLKIELEHKKDLDTVISSFRPPIFWKDKDLIKQQLKFLTLPQIKLIIIEINNLELLVKKNSKLSNQIVDNFILDRLEMTNS